MGDETDEDCGPPGRANNPPDGPNDPPPGGPNDPPGEVSENSQDRVIKIRIPKTPQDEK